MFVDRQRDAFVSTRRYERYWQQAPNGQSLPYLDAVQFKIISDNVARSQALSAGDIDGHVVNTPDALLSAVNSGRDGRTQIITDSNLETDETVLGFNTTKPPFDDPIARQALEYGIDQQQMSAGIYQGLFPAAWGMFEESSQYYISRKDAGYPERDISKARELVHQYEQAHGQPLEFSTLVPPDTQYLAIAQTFQSQAAELGMKVNVEAVEQTQLVARVVAAGNYQASWFVLWSSPAPDRAYIFLGTVPRKM